MSGVTEQPTLVKPHVVLCNAVMSPGGFVVVSEALCFVQCATGVKTPLLLICSDLQSEKDEKQHNDEAIHLGEVAKLWEEATAEGVLMALFDVVCDEVQWVDQ